MEETAHYAKRFCRDYIDAHNDPHYQYAYRIFHHELSDGHHRKEIFLLTLAHQLGKNRAGRLLFKVLLKARGKARGLWRMLVK